MILLYVLIQWRIQPKIRFEHERSEKEKEIFEIRPIASEVEMQALRPQMNHHFNFKSIYRFMSQNNRSQASEYLAKFSKLVQLILQNFQASLIRQQSGFESLELYRSLEALRFNFRFAYKILVPKDLDIGALMISPLV